METTSITRHETKDRRAGTCIHCGHRVTKREAAGSTYCPAPGAGKSRATRRAEAIAADIAATDWTNEARRPASNQSEPMATEKQISYIKSLIRRNGTDDLSVKLPADLTTLTRRDASSAINTLKGNG